MGSSSSHSIDPGLEPQSPDEVTMVDYLDFAEQVAEKMQSPSCSPQGLDRVLGERGVSEESKHALGMIVFYDSHLSRKPGLVPAEWHDWARLVTESDLSRDSPSLSETLATMTDMELSGEVISKLSVSVVTNNDFRSVATPALSALSRREPPPGPRGVRNLLRSLSGSSTSSWPGEFSSIAELQEGQEQGEGDGDGVCTPPRSSTEISTVSGFSPLQKIKSWGSSSKNRAGRKP